MEIEGDDGSKSLLREGSEMEFGRWRGFKSDDRTVSRRHVKFQLHLSDDSRVRFVVIGKNPIWVHRSRTGEVKTFRTSESGEMEIDDMFCVSAKGPIWFSLKRIEFESHNDNYAQEELGVDTQLPEGLGSRYESEDIGALEPESVDISQFDPVKEFGFMVIGQEFDSYPKKMIQDIKNWDWFTEETGTESEDDDFEERKRKKSGKRKRKKGEEDYNEEWSAQSEEEKEQITVTKIGQRPKYLTRSKDRNDHSKISKGKGADSLQKRNKHTDEEEVDEDDETLGGFIVDSDELDQEEEIDEEEEFDEEEEEDELD